jgi:hypothetical protein
VTTERTALGFDVNAEMDDVTVQGNPLPTGQMLNLFIPSLFRKKRYRAGAPS